MPLPVAILLGLLPSLGWLWLLHRRDDHEREPVLLALLALALGGGAALAALWLRPLVEVRCGPFGAATDAFVVTALVEETLKLLALVPLLRHRELDEPLDGVVYGGAVGLGFAAVENVCYGTMTQSAALLVQRAFTATLAHACFTGCLGFCFALARLRRGRGRAMAIAWRAAGVAIAVLLHGSYDLFLGGERLRALLSLLVVLPAALALLAWKVRWARARSAAFHPRPR